MALQASVLARRIFDTRGRRRDALDPARTEIVMAIALIETAPRELTRTSVESLASQLSLHGEAVRELVFDLLRSGHVRAVHDEPGEDPAGFQLTAGWAVARAAVERAGRFLPGWPPAPTRR
ncbi:MAG TPA: hypothetical protein VD836_13255 [Solirubrobacteraceae bacterium]|nr:hypothetical protein [Solirubrobacteraceae bacterium]